jgi:hypothetical protein
LMQDFLQPGQCWHQKSKAVQKHFPEASETNKGHTRRVQLGVRSTKAQAQEHLEIKIEEALTELAKLRLQVKHHPESWLLHMVQIKVKEASRFSTRIRPADFQ